MPDFLALITNGAYWRLHSLVIKFILRIYGVRIGKRVHIRGVPKLKIRGRASNIIIHDDVSILGDVDLRNRENGTIIFGQEVTIEGSTRFVAARDGRIQIGRGSIVTAFCILNGGGNILIGEHCIIGPRSSLNANEHVMDRNTPIRQAGFIHEDIVIEDDCWLAANVAVTKGVRLAQGSVVAANAVVTRDTEPYSINAGVPAKKIGERS